MYFILYTVHASTLRFYRDYNYIKKAETGHIIATRDTEDMKFTEVPIKRIMT